MKTRTGICRYVAVFVVALLVSAVPGEMGAQGLKKVTIFTGTTPQFAACYVAESKGFYRDFGLDAEVKIFTTGSDAVNAFMAGKGSFVLSGDFPAIRLWAQHPEVLGVFPIANYEEMTIVVGRRELRGPADLKGKRVAVRMGSTAEFFALRYLASAGLRKDDVIIKDLPPPEMVVALERGDIDAYVIWQPFGWQSLKVSGNKVHIMSTAKGFFTEYVLFSTTKEFAQKEPDAVKGLLRAIMKANEYIRTNMNDAVEAVATRLKLDRELTRNMMVTLRYDVGYTPDFRRSMDELANFMVERRALSKGIDWSASFDPSLLRAISPDLAR